MTVNLARQIKICLNVKNKNLIFLFKATGFPISKASTTFFLLKQAFTKTPIFQHFDLKYHIRIKTNALSYVIDRVLNQLTLNFYQ